MGMRFATLAFALAFAAASLVPVSVPDRERTDVNGDGACDILDVQAVTAALLSVDACGAADVNCDGCVNLLDLQQTVATASGSPGAQQAPSQPSDGGIALLVAVVDAPAPKLGPMTLSPLAVLPAPGPLAAGPSHECPFRPSPNTERLLLGLTPHAPPLLS